MKIKKINIFLYCIATTCLSAQEMKITAKIDTTSNEITTFVSLINIPEGGRVRFQQRLLPNAKIITLPYDFLLWDTAKNILTIITTKYPRIDTLIFTFVCRTGTLSDAIFWGESALMYEKKSGIVQKITLPARNYTVKQPLVPNADSLVKGMFYIQVSASKTVQNKENIAKMVHLQKEHIVLEEKSGKFYKYFIGNFTAKEQANIQLKYYKQYISDAFIVNY